MWQTNPTWGSPRIQAELAKLGIAISDSNVRKYRPKHRRSVSTQTWKTFLYNHAKELVAIDFFTVPTATCRVLSVFLVLAHERRKVLHFNITDAPSAIWTAQQMVEAFPFSTPPRYLLRDRDAIYGVDFVRRVKSLGLEQKLIAPRAPWQNPVAERVSENRPDGLRRDVARTGAVWPAKSCMRLAGFISPFPGGSIEAIEAFLGYILPLGRRHGRWNNRDHVPSVPFLSPLLARM